MYKVVIFDLWDTIAYLKGLSNLNAELEARLGKVRFEEVKKRFVEWHLNTEAQKVLLRSLTKDLDASSEESQLIKAYLDPKEATLFPETIEALQKLKDKNIPVILLTNSPPTSKINVSALGLVPYFTRLLFSCDMGLMKPQKEFYKKAIEGLVSDPSDALMIGDSYEKDYLGAKAAGLSALHLVRTGQSPTEESIKNLLEVLKFI